MAAARNSILDDRVDFVINVIAEDAVDCEMTCRKVTADIRRTIYVHGPRGNVLDRYMKEYETEMNKGNGCPGQWRREYVAQLEKLLTEGEADSNIRTVLAEIYEYDTRNRLRYKKTKDAFKGDPQLGMLNYDQITDWALEYEGHRPAFMREEARQALEELRVLANAHSNSVPRSNVQLTTQSHAERAPRVMSARSKDRKNIRANRDEIQRAHENDFNQTY